MFESKFNHPTIDHVTEMAFSEDNTDEFFENEYTYEEVPQDDEIMQVVTEYGLEHSNNPNPIGCGIVMEKTNEDGTTDREILFLGANFSQYHADNFTPLTKGCKRYREDGSPIFASGKGYETCPGCDYSNHAEFQTVKHALEAGIETEGATMYMSGHYWACQSCWRAMLSAGITRVVIPEGSREEYEKRKLARTAQHELPTQETN